MYHMKTYFIQFEVVPAPANEQFGIAKGALAACWVVESTPEAALAKATFQVSKYDWQIVVTETPPVEVTESDFAEKDLGLELFKKSQVEGWAFSYFAWAKDGKTSTGPLALNSSYKPDLAASLKKQKQVRKSGRCLHFDKGIRCSEIINAHSIQKKQSLMSISRNGHVYTLSTNMGSIIKNKGLPAYELNGINNVSTFLGFCKTHDNELFEIIDNYPLEPTEHQVFLYAYRSLCRELYVKENASILLKEHISNAAGHDFIRSQFENMSVGTDYGLNNLKIHKSAYDESLKYKRYNDINYVVFMSDSQPNMVFSGLFYPDFDFMGRQLQYLGNIGHNLELITFCSCPMATGWGFLFAWHNSGSRACKEFMASLATQIHEGHKISDLLFRLVISCCENHAISPEWYDSLSAEKLSQIVERFNLSVSPFSVTPSTYLSEGLEGIGNWEFKFCRSNLTG